MLVHILKKDLKRKKTMNAILFLFITLATLFLGSSVSNLLTISGAVDSFLERAKTPDYFIVSLASQTENEMKQFFDKCSYVKEYEAIESLSLSQEDIEIVSCASEPDRTEYEKGDVLCIGSLPENFTKVFDMEGESFALRSGEIALVQQQAEANGLQSGDVLRVRCGDNAMEFTVKTLVKDAVFGSEMVGMKRLFITKEDYAALREGTDEPYLMFYNLNLSDWSAFYKEYKQMDFKILSEAQKDTIKMCYIFDMLMAVILIVVSLCLILVSFLILRFTIVFTLQEDYREIGIMKAIGIRDLSIRGIYLLKYLVLSVMGAFLGVIGCFPFEQLLLKNSIPNIFISNAESWQWVRALCAVLIILTVLLFCYGSSGKVKKFTAIAAIRQGGNGERYRAKSRIRLRTKMRMRPCFYMACNDVFSNLKRYVLLIIIFGIGILEILLPLTAIHTLKDDDIITSFDMQKSTLFLDNGRREKYYAEPDATSLKKDLENTEKILEENGFPTDAWYEVAYTIPVYGENPQDTISCQISQQKGREADNYTVLRGTVPELSSEIMVTEMTAQELGVDIGDQVHFQYGEREESCMVTGIYQSMNNFGKGIRVSRLADIDYSYIGYIQSMQLLVESELAAEEIKERVQEIFPDCDIKLPQEYVNGLVGGVLDTMNVLKWFIAGLVLLINVLITALMMKTFIAREHGEIAMLKSLGFDNRSIRGWQSYRILIVLVAAILLGILLERPLAELVISPIFTMMGGTGIKLVMEPMETYLVFPSFLLLGTGLAAYVCSAEVQKIGLKEINTLE